MNFSCYQVVIWRIKCHSVRVYSLNYAHGSVFCFSLVLPSVFLDECYLSIQSWTKLIVPFKLLAGFHILLILKLKYILAEKMEQAKHNIWPNMNVWVTNTIKDQRWSILPVRTWRLRAKVIFLIWKHVHSTITELFKPLVTTVHLKNYTHTTRFNAPSCLKIPGPLLLTGINVHPSTYR